MFVQPRNQEAHKWEAAAAWRGARVHERERTRERKSINANHIYLWLLTEVVGVFVICTSIMEHLATVFFITDFVRVISLIIDDDLILMRYRATHYETKVAHLSIAPDSSRGLRWPRSPSERPRAKSPGAVGLKHINYHLTLAKSGVMTQTACPPKSIDTKNGAPTKWATSAKPQPVIDNDVQFGSGARHPFARHRTDWKPNLSLHFCCAHCRNVFFIRAWQKRGNGRRNSKADPWSGVYICMVFLGAYFIGDIIDWISTLIRFPSIPRLTCAHAMQPPRGQNEKSPAPRVSGRLRVCEINTCAYHRAIFQFMHIFGVYTFVAAALFGCAREFRRRKTKKDFA